MAASGFWAILGNGRGYRQFVPTSETAKLILQPVKGDKSLYKVVKVVGAWPELGSRIPMYIGKALKALAPEGDVMILSRKQPKNALWPSPE